MTAVATTGVLEGYLDLALAGRPKPAVRLALQMLDQGVPAGVIIEGILAPAQRSVGDRWQRNEIGVADEHVVTGVTHAVLHALADAAPEPSRSGRVVMACAEGDWHAVAAHMMAEQLRAGGFPVTFLGASTPPDDLPGFLARHGATALALSCNLPTFYAGVARLADAAHQVGVPVLAGGRALGGDPRRALRLGADGWAADAERASTLLADWQDHPPDVSSTRTRLDRESCNLQRRAGDLADGAMGALSAAFPPMAAHLAQTRADLVSIVEFTAAAQMVGDPRVLLEFLDWLDAVLSSRQVPRSALRAGLEVLRPLLREAGSGAARLADLGIEHLAGGR